MEALLGQYGLGALGSDTPRSTNGCASVDELQYQLQNAVAAKRSDSRAEHISAQYEIRMSAVFHISEQPDVTPGEAVEQPQAPVTRTVNASETILNQTDDPKLQRLVAKHLVGALGAVDDTIWTVREVSRPQGWQFKYQCKSSLAEWNRQHAKSSDRPPIGAFSGNGGLDPVNLSRPAFDCRGSLSITFSKSSRAIVVKYEHTPLHMSVATLVDRLQATLPPPPAANINTPTVNRSAKAKRPPPAEGEDSSRKKRKKKGKATEDNGDTETQTQVSNAIPDGTQAAPVPQNPQLEPPLLKIPPQEAARRADLARQLLTDRGIDPASLSEEQFSIFSNQAPHLQDASLDMLAKYGAERLRIVHPDEKGQSTTASSTPAQATNAGNGLASPLTPAAETPSKPKKARKRKSNAAVVEGADGAGGDVSILEFETPAGNATSQLLSRKRTTRGACNTCKLAKRKCTKEHPQCSVCEEQGDTCVYLPPKARPRRSEVSAEAVAEEDLADDVEDNAEQTGDALPTPEPAASDAHDSQVHPNPDDDEFIPDPHILSASIEHHDEPLLYYQEQAHSTEATYNQSSAPQRDTTTSALDFAQTHSQQAIPQSTTEAPYSHSQSAQTIPEPSYSAAPPVRQHVSGSNRRSLPTTQNATHSAQVTQPSASADAYSQSSAPNDAYPQSITGWNSTARPTTSVEQTSNQPTNMSQSQASRRPRSRKSGGGTNSPAFDSYQAAAVLSQTPVPVPVPVPRQNQSPATTRSPFQNPVQKAPSRAKSRQGQRSQSRTPVSQTPVPPPVIPTAQNATLSPSYHTTATSAHPTPAPATYEPFTRYNGSSNDRYPESASGQSSRIAYEPYSYTQANTSNASNTYTSSYDYSRGNAANNPLNQALNDTSDHPPSQQALSASTTSNSYKTPSQAQAPMNQAYGAQGSQRQTATPDTSYAQSQHQHRQHSRQQPQSQQSQHSQPQTQAYNSYTQPENGTQQQQNQNWYNGFSSSNTTPSHANYNANTRNAGYEQTQPTANSGYNQGQRPNGSEYNGYSQDIYDLLRANGSGNHR